MHSAVQNRNKVCLLVRSYSTISISEGNAEDELLKRLVSSLSAVPAVGNFQLLPDFSR